MGKNGFIREYENYVNDEEMNRMPKEKREPYDESIMTVKDMINTLSKFDPNLPIMIYSLSEDGGMVGGVSIQTTKNAHYFKADHPFYYCDIDKAVCIEE